MGLGGLPGRGLHLGRSEGEPGMRAVVDRLELLTLWVLVLGVTVSSVGLLLYLICWSEDVLSERSFRLQALASLRKAIATQDPIERTIYRDMADEFSRKAREAELIDAVGHDIVKSKVVVLYPRRRTISAKRFG